MSISADIYVWMFYSKAYTLIVKLIRLDLQWSILKLRYQVEWKASELLAAGFFKYVGPSSGHQALKGHLFLNDRV